jgi:hypothetical protein
MKTIYKYPIQDGFTVLELPKDAEILTVQTQEGKVFVWVLLNTEQPKVKWKFIIKATGENIEEDLSKANYIGTFQHNRLGGGFLVWHLFGYWEE